MRAFNERLASFEQYGRGKYRCYGIPHQDIRNLAMIFDKTEKAEEIISKIQADVEIGKKAAEGKEPQKILILESWKGEYDVYPVGYGLAYTPGIRCGSTVKMFLKYLCGIE